MARSTAVTIGACDPEVLFPAGARTAVAKALTKVNYEELPIGRFNLDWETGRVWVSAKAP